MKKSKPGSKPDCDCGRPASYEACCGRFHTHPDEPAPDAESLMRSRYSAYVRQLETYLLETWHASTRPPALNLKEDATQKWFALEVKGSRTSADFATVEFTARYRVNGRAQRLDEKSQFVREHGRWYYVAAL